jgi:hypothetical protein
LLLDRQIKSNYERTFSTLTTKDELNKSSIAIILDKLTIKQPTE